MKQSIDIKRSFGKSLRVTGVCHSEGEVETEECWRGGKKAAFTLAEVLITLVIVGLVAAMTLPTLIAKINNKVTSNQKEVFKAKMVKGFNLTKAAGELNNTYSSTYDFLTNGLSKHLKLAKICDSSHIRDCLPYDSIKYNKNENTEETFEVSKFNIAGNLNLEEKNGYKDSAAFVLGDGTVVVGSYNLGCVADDGELDKEITKCFDGLYDLNGTRKPNKLGKDILPIRSAGINASPVVLATLGGVKIISNAQVYDGVKLSEYCKNDEPIKEYKDAGVTQCCTDCDSAGIGGDRWAVAAKACYDMGGRLPNAQDLADIATALYGGTESGGRFSTNHSEEGAGKIGSGEAIPEVLSGLADS